MMSMNPNIVESPTIVAGGSPLIGHSTVEAIGETVSEDVMPYLGPLVGVLNWEVHALKYLNDKLEVPEVKSTFKGSSIDINRPVEYHHTPHHPDRRKDEWYYDRTQGRRKPRGYFDVPNGGNGSNVKVSGTFVSPPATQRRSSRKHLNDAYMVSPNIHQRMHDMTYNPFDHQIAPTMYYNPVDDTAGYQLWYGRRKRLRPERPRRNWL